MTKQSALKKKPRSRSSIKLKSKRVSQTKTIKKYLKIGAAFICSMFFLTTVFIYRFITQNITSAFSTDNVTFMETGYPTVLYIVADNIHSDNIHLKKVEFKIFDMEGKKVVTYSIPLEYELDAPGRYGMEKISNIFTLGQIKGKSTDPLLNGITELNMVMLKLFGINAEKYVLVQEDMEKPVETFWASGDITPFFNKGNLSGLKNTIKSNFSPSELYKLSNFINTLPSDRLISNKYLAEYIDNKDAIDQEIRDMMLLSQISKEGLSVAILNGTDKEGVASFGSRIVENNGGRVVAVSNSIKPVEHSVIITDRQDSLTVRKLAKIFGVSPIINKQDAKSQFSDSELDRADVVLVIGFDLASSL
jgi:hypothetical protein